MNKEQEDLLTLLQEMETKLKQYKKELRHRGYTHLSDDDEEEEEYTVNTQQQHQHQEIKQEEEQHQVSNEDIFEPNYNNRMSEIINNKQLSNSTSSNSVADHANSSLSTDTSCSSNTSSYGDQLVNKKKSQDNKILMNYPPQTGQNIVNATNTIPIDPFFQNHPFFSQTNQTSESNSLQNYFK